MLIALPLAFGVVAATVWRQARAWRSVWLVAAVALAVRLAACVVIYSLTRPVNDTGEWLADESAFFKATQSLMPNPLDRQIQGGLEHLGGDGYLGLTTALSLAGGGVADTNVFRVVNAALGTLVVVLGMLIARRMFGARASLAAGLALAVWPTLVLWSATMLRDTLGSVTVVTLWWTLGRARELGWVRTWGTVFLTSAIALSLRPYLGAAMLLGVAAWASYPRLRRLGVRRVAVLAASGAVLLGAVAVYEAKQIDFAVHELLYRRTVTRIETLGQLYTDYPPMQPNQPMRPGAAVGLVDPASGWILGGVVQDFDGPDIARVYFTDETLRDVPVSKLVLLESTVIPPLQLVAEIGPDLFTYLTGTATSGAPGSPAWVAAALAWDALLLLTIVAAARARLSPREWLYPLCVVAGTVTALIAVPGAPGNADRHRATQTVPLLLVLASELASTAPLLRRRSGLAVNSMTSSPPSAPAPASSRMRSAR